MKAKEGVPQDHCAEVEAGVGTAGGPGVALKINME